MAAATPSKTPAPLTGLRVLDFTHVLAGPFCTRLLADLGADVVRVESSKHPDHPWQSRFVSADGRHASYLNTNRSKRSIAIDLKRDGGRKLAVRLAGLADVAIENFSAGVMDRLELGYDNLHSLNPRLIYVSMSGYGHVGPRRDWTSMNMNLQGYSGLMTVSGSEGDPPTAISNSWNDYIGGLHACFAVLQALEERRRNGTGQRIDLSQFECSAAMIGSLLLAGAVTGEVPRRLGNRSDRYAPQGVYRCAGIDQWCALCIENETQWMSLTALIGQDSWRADPRFESVAGRMRWHDEIDHGISSWTAQYTKEEVESRLRNAGISAARVRRINEVLVPSDPSAAYRQMPERRVGSMWTTKLPITLSPVNIPEPRSAPSLGEHSLEVLREWLNCSDAELDELQNQGVLQ